VGSIIILALGRLVKWPFNPTTFQWREKACLARGQKPALLI